MASCDWTSVGPWRSSGHRHGVRQGVSALACKKGSQRRSVSLPCSGFVEDKILQKSVLSSLRFLAGVELEIQQSEGVTWKELMLPSNRLRMFIAISIQLCQQLTGNTSLAYYAPQIFATIGAGNKTLFITGFFGIVKIAGVLLFLVAFVDTVGRRKPFMGGAFAMGSFMLIIGIIVATRPPKKEATNITGAGAAGIAMVYLEAFSFNMSWGPLTLAVHRRDLSQPHPRDRCCNRSSESVAVQLHDEPDHASRDRQHWLEDVPDVRDLQLRDHLLQLFCTEGDGA